MSLRRTETLTMPAHGFGAGTSHKRHSFFAIAGIPLPALPALIVLLCLLAVAGCDRREPAELTLAQLVAQQESYNGRSVVASGILRSHPQPLHYWIEDEAGNRVELLYHDSLEPLLGEHMAVRGRFLYAPDRGRRIEVEYLTPTP
jgi:hypothetical protein